MTEPVELLECSSKVYSLSLFRTLGGTAAAPPSPTSEGAGSPHLGGGIAAAPPSHSVAGVGVLSDAARVAYDAKIAAQRESETPAARIANARAKLVNLTNASTRALAKHVLAGESFAQPGERSELALRVTGAITRVEPALSADEVLSLLRPSLDAMAAQAPGVTDEWALEMIHRQIESARAKSTIADAHDPGILAVLQRAAGAVEATDDEEPATPYTPEQIKKFADTQDCSPADFTKRWIIQWGESFSIFCRGKYLAPIQRGMLEVSIPRDLSLVQETGPAKIERRKVNKDGTTSLKDVSDMLLDYATAARNVVVSLILKNSHYDPATQTFHQAVCPVRKIAAKFNPHIDKWLRLLGGEEAEKLLDWVATVTDLTRQTCALYFDGERGAGKGMFADGMARLWTANGSPTALARVLDNFNDGLLTCPLLFGDEHVPKNKNTTAMLRQIIASSGRALSKKFMDDAILDGCLRLILAGNNGHLLDTKEELSSADVEAVGQRFLHIKVSTEPVKYLASLNGLSRTEGWVARDAIAAHAIWLRDNRRVTLGDRFLVEGHQTAFHQSMMTRGTVEGMVLEWLVKFLNSTEAARAVVAQKQGGGHVLVGGGQFLVNTQALADNWANFVGSDNKVPPTSRIGEVLGKFSKSTQPQVRSHNVRFHNIDLDLIFNWADKHLVGIPETMKDLIEHELTAKDLLPIRKAELRIIEGGN